MANKKLRDLDAATALAAEDLIYVVQSDEASPPTYTDKHATVQQVLDLVVGSGGSVDPATFGHRLTLVSGQPVHIPRPVTPTATDHATTDTVTLPSGHNLVTGDRCTIGTTVGGLTSLTLYYLNVSGNTASFHTTLADAQAQTNKVNLSADITYPICPTGVEATGTIYLEPFKSDRMALWDGSTWQVLDSGDAAVPVTLPSLSAGEQRDLFIKIDTGAISYEWSAAWSGDNTRADAIVRKNGVWVKSGTPTLRYVGTVRAHATDTLIDDGGGIVNKVGARRFLFNAHNRIERVMELIYQNGSSTYTYSSSTVQRLNGTIGNDCVFQFVAGLAEDVMPVQMAIGAINGQSANFGANINNAGAIRNRPPHPSWGQIHAVTSSGSIYQSTEYHSTQLPVLGFNTLYFLEQAFSGTVTVRPWECQFTGRFKM
ncbi:MAG TPA: hypothetical protein VFY29_07185 [Terriglobia bacterium]|nr:hypothetical protein [Terriglobia bacterium]